MIPRVVSVIWVKHFSEVEETHNGICQPWKQSSRDDLLLVLGPVFVRQRSHEVRHVELVEWVRLQDGNKVQKVLVASQQPPNVHDLHLHLRVDEFLF